MRKRKPSGPSQSITVHRNVGSSITYPPSESIRSEGTFIPAHHPPDFFVLLRPLPLSRHLFEIRCFFFFFLYRSLCLYDSRREYL